ncbi:MAG TPA: histidinol dehydrogenase, partial [Sedimentisphaerales bacterium]|nr:histidinol dehydrogenase [Sedimentisphaerales bacterium]
MSDGLQDLLILTSDPQARARLAKLRLDMLGAARSASENSEQNRTVVEVLRDIRERGDEAVAAYTEKFDRVTLRPDEFRVGPDALA